MPRKQKFKVFRTPIGFHDAYVAAPSQKAAMQAWGSDADLFARGIAERVDDPELMREPLENPGKVIRRLRGTMAEQLAALPKDAPPQRAKASSPEPKALRRQAVRKASAKPAPRSKPKPDRTALDRAEQALAAIEQRQQGERDALARRQAALEREQRQLERTQDRERATAEQHIEATRVKYEKATRMWRG